MVRTTFQQPRSRQLVRAHLALLAAIIFAWGALAQDSGPARDAWQHPEEVMDAIEVHAGSVVADVGCGAGYFTFHLADRVGPSGHVYAVDILQSRLDEIDREVRKEGLKQITTILGSPDDPHLPPNSLDAVLAMNTFHEWRQYNSMLKHLYEALKPGGLFGLIDGVAAPGHPRSYYYERHRMPEEMERADLTRAGFHFVRQEPGFTNPEERKKFYFLIFEKPR
ncbi:MAG TPA: class I SAM-dependent methyltransferase [Terriglobia bacterium]|nr:class I SAM-dependent methyltransferase [Terriglobia bacterium]